MKKLTKRDEKLLICGVSAIKPYPKESLSKRIKYAKEVFLEFGGHGQSAISSTLLIIARGDYHEHSNAMRDIRAAIAMAKRKCARKK